MMGAARQRNLLVHGYLELDPVKVCNSLDHLDALRAFALAIQRVLGAHAEAEQPRHHP